MKITPNHRDLALLYHRRLPADIWTHLGSIGLSEAVIHRYRLGWDGDRITIPIANRDRKVTFFRLARGPGDTTGAAEITSSRGAYPELYGWEHLGFKRENLVICDGEFDRLVLEAHDIPAVTAVAGDGKFLEAWAVSFAEVENLFVCFHNDEPGGRRARRVARFIPQCRVVQLPTEVGQSGTVTDFFITLARSREDFLGLLQSAGDEQAESAISSSLS
jgi:hypothetical protein